MSIIILDQNTVMDGNGSAVGQGQDRLKFIAYFKEEREDVNIVAHLLRNYDEEEFDVRNKVARVKNILVDQLDNFGATKQEHFRKYIVADKLKQYLQFFCGDRIESDKKDEGAKILEMKKTYIGYLQTTIDELIGKVKRYRQMIEVSRVRNSRQGKINKLIYKSYNLKNYIQQLLLVKDLKQRVQRILQKQIPDIRHVQELSRKTTVPYAFYHIYCLNNCCRVIEKRINMGQLVMLIHSSSNIVLLEHIKYYFFSGKNISQKCLRLLIFCGKIRLMNRDKKCMENGFLLSFRPYFMEAMKETSQITSVEYLKARSIMQSDDQFIDIWRQFEGIKVEEYCYWYYQQMKWLRKSENAHLQKVREILRIYREKYSWTDEVNFKTHKIQQKGTFANDFTRMLLCKILRPLLLFLFFEIAKEQSNRYLEKSIREYKQYWIYWLFHKHKRKLHGMINNFDRSEKINIFEDTELSLSQYYSYYKLLGELIQRQLGQKQLAGDYQQFWKEIVVKVSTFLPQQKKIEVTKKIEEVYQSQKYYQKQYQKLKLLLQNKKMLTKDNYQEQIYQQIMKLQYNIGNYFIISKSMKELSKETCEEIGMIREISYGQFYK